MSNATTTTTWRTALGRVRELAETLGFKVQNAPGENFSIHIPGLNIGVVYGGSVITSVPGQPGRMWVTGTDTPDGTIRFVCDRMIGAYLNR
jgi:hypothetical protein